MRLAALIISVAAIGAVAWAQETAPPPAPTETSVASSPASEAPKERRKRYVNAEGEELICKPISGMTGTHLKGRGRMICGTKAEWDDSHSRVRRAFDEMIQQNTPSPRG